MYDNREIFFAVFGALAAILFLLIIFEKKLIAYEEMKKAEKHKNEKIKALERLTDTQFRVIEKLVEDKKQLETFLVAQKTINGYNLELLFLERKKKSTGDKKNEN